MCQRNNAAFHNTSKLMTAIRSIRVLPPHLRQYPSSFKTRVLENHKESYFRLTMTSNNHNPRLMLILCIHLPTRFNLPIRILLARPNPFCNLHTPPMSSSLAILPESRSLASHLSSLRTLFNAIRKTLKNYLYLFQQINKMR